ncbi:non-muscle caldesmon isoform X1 [Anguilla anguilla]|uniref:non-muscle caldesmon isoform X1 n=1 Tax=Anguilla anguilla TaxID=7936 RepID=UPI0015ADDC37|nr:non-muscle caldesmon isoform X1 [Anguilla anguilla]
MSSAILRRNSSKEGLQNLLRITAQRSIEDAEEIERERRRRAREAFRSTSSQSDSPRDGGTAAEDSPVESELKPSSQQALEEDEGFSDWTQKLERRRQRRLEEQGPAEDEEEEEEQRRRRRQQQQQRGPSRDERTRPPQAPRLAGREEEEEEEEEWESHRRSRRWREEEEEKLREDGRMKAVKRAEEPKRERDEMAKEKRKEVKVSYTSKVFLSQEVKHFNGNGEAAGEEVTSHLLKTIRPLRSASQGGAQDPEEDAEVFLETEQKLEKFRRSHQEKESQELELLRQKQAESEAELEELKKRREERRKIREEEERRREEEEYQRQLKEEKERRHMKEEIERRRMEATERRMKNLSTSSIEGDEPFSPISPKSPSFKGEGEDRVAGETAYSITERTESLNRSLKKSNSVKKTQPPLLNTSLDNKLEQYSHAIEEAKLSKQGVVDIPCPPEPVASKKSLFEAGEAWNQNSPKTTPSKDAEGLKVGVADLITQWVKGNPDGSSRNSPSKPADIKAGDVLHKKNIWESIRDSSSAERSTAGGKGTPSGKRYKFVVMGHGKYEKVPLEDGEYEAYANEKPGGLSHQDS